MTSRLNQREAGVVYERKVKHICSIAGFYCYGENRPSIETLKGLMIASQNRGKSAAGMAYMNAYSQIMIRKQAGPAEDLVHGMTDENWDEVARSPRALFHARATTKGTEKENVNNHPVSAYGWVVVHNGHVNNDDDLFSHYSAERYAEVDTAAIPLVLTQGTTYEDSLRHLSILSGQVSTAIWSLDYPDKIAIARLGSNDVYLFLDPVNNIMYWCSTPIGGKSIPGFVVGNLAFFTVSKLHENRVLILEPTSEKLRLLKIERQPFLVRKQQNYSYTPGNNGAGPVVTLPTGTGLACSRVVGETKSHTNFTWLQPNKECSSKPGIDSSGIQSSWFTWDQVQAYFKTDYVSCGDKEATFTLPTAYGRWIFKCPSTKLWGVFDSQFLPARRIKKFWRRNYDKEIPQTKLPTTLGALDTKLTLEEFALVEQTTTTPPGKIHHMGYMCPWCGITMPTHSWYNLGSRCPACGIVSYPYKKEGD